MAVAMDILAEHAEEASFLWHLRGTAVAGTAHDRESLADLDDRILAHLDGLLIGDERGWAYGVALQASQPRPAEAFPMAWLALVVDAPDRRKALRAALEANPSVAPAVASAVAWLPDSARAAAVPWLWTWGDLGRLAALEGSVAVRAVDPGLIQAAFADASPAVRALALRAIGACGQRDGLDHCRRRLGGDPVEVAAAAWSLGLLEGQALDHLEAIAKHDAAARAVLLRRSPAARARAWSSAVLRPRDEITAAVERADISAIGRLLDALDDPLLARQAGWAISALSGADAARDGLLGQPLSGADEGPSDDPADPRVALDADRDLPWLDQARARDWWSGRQATLTTEGRILVGEPITVESCRLLLDGAAQPLRRCAAFEIAVLTGSGLFPVDAPTHRQRRLEGDGWFR